MSYSVAIRPVAVPAWHALQHGLEQAEDDRLTIPCRVADPIGWDGTSSQWTEYAESQCQLCPVIHQCGNYADAARETSGIWGGRDRSQPHRSRSAGLFGIGETA